MKINTNSILISFGVLAFAAMACFPITMLAMPLLQPAQPAPDDSLATVQAAVTQTVSAMTQTAPTQTPVPASPTSIPPTSTAVPPTNTPPPTATAVSYCDWVMFITDVTIPDGSKFAPGDTFTKVWRLKNRGTCTWTADYTLVFVRGDQMSGTTAVRLPGNVYPGQTVDVSVTLTAPDKRGHYVGYWMLRNPYGVLFGYGVSANQAFYVDIMTENLPHGEVTGNICYPSEFNPPLTLYFELKGTSQVIQFSIPENTPTYRVLLPNGTYYAYAWAPNYNLEGAYVHPERIMKSFVVRGGQTTTNINICDWDIYPHARGE